MKKQDKRIVKLAAAAAAGMYLHLQNTWIQTSRYNLIVENLEPENDQLKIVHLSDLHLPKQRVQLKKLAKQVAAEQPDLIFLTGDQIDGDLAFEEESAARFFKSLTQTAPAYAVSGNHDRHASLSGKIEEIYEKTGITFLKDEAYSVVLENGKPLVVMGVSDKSTAVRKVTKNSLAHINMRATWKNQTKLLLAHRPEEFAKHHKDKSKSPDITFSGHAHGGQVRIPGVGGLFAPGQGRMPKYTDGVFEFDEDPSKRLVISRGIGASSFPIRINNRPEMIVVRLLRP